MQFYINIVFPFNTKCDFQVFKNLILWIKHDFVGLNSIIFFKEILYRILSKFIFDYNQIPYKIKKANKKIYIYFKSLAIDMYVIKRMMEYEG